MGYGQDNTPSSGRSAGDVGLSNSLHARAFSLHGLMLSLGCDGVKLLFIAMASLWRPEEQNTWSFLQMHQKKITVEWSARGRTTMQYNSAVQMVRLKN